MIIAYLLKSKNWTLQQAWQHVTKVTPWELNINFGFKGQLMNLEFKQQGKEVCAVNPHCFYLDLRLR